MFNGVSMFSASSYIEKLQTIFRLSETGPGCKDQCFTGGRVVEINACSMVHWVICLLLVKIFTLGDLSFSDENFSTCHLQKIIFYQSIEELEIGKKNYAFRSVRSIRQSECFVISPMSNIQM
jgi:hypothetical protein